MNSNDFLTRITQSFKSDLPGIEAHKITTPGNRPLIRSAVENIQQYRESAVAIICFPINDEVHSLLIQRPVYEGNHSGQISFPGGKIEPNDQNLEYTARRETFEEIGWKLNADNYQGSLTEMFIPISKFIVQPYLYYVDNMQAFIPDEREVSEIITYPIKNLLEPSILKSTTIRHNDKIRLKNIPYFDIQNKVVWGATAIILSELRMMLHADKK